MSAVPGSTVPGLTAPGSTSDGSAPTELTLAFDNNKLASLVFGDYDQNLAHVERRLGIQATANGNHVVIRGTRDGAEQGRRVLENLYDRVRGGRTLSLGDVDGAIQESALQGTLFPAKQNRAAFEQIATRRKGPVKARNTAQDSYLRALRRFELVFSEGPAGTGKTWLAVGHAVQLLEQGIVERLVLSRPAVEAGERLGFLPGDLREKVDPYLRPIYDALADFMDPRAVARGMETGQIEVAPLAFMRGRTLTKAAILLDEAQNCTSMQMKMFLTRLGEGSRMIVTGDPSQVDLPPGQKSGLVEAIGILSDVEGVGHVAFADSDVVRHELVRRIVTAYDMASRLAAPGDDPLSALLTIEVSVEDGDWPAEADSSQFCSRVLEAAAAGSGLRVRPGAAVSVLLTSDAGVRTLNREWRGLDKPTNVLSFQAVAADRVAGSPALGDIVLARGILEREAREEGRTVEAHWAHLLVHGFLHLVGLDHEDGDEADRMERLETRILEGLGVANPYALTEPAE